MPRAPRPGHVRRPQRARLELRRRDVGAAAPRGVLVEGRREHRQRHAAHPVVGRSARPPQVPPPARPRVLADEDGGARARSACARERDHRRVRRQGGACEFHEDFATPLPSTIFLALIGLPQSDLPDFLRWRDDTIRPEGSTPEEVEAKRQAAGHAINEYFVKALEEKRKNPDDRLLSRIVTGEVDGRPLTQAEKLGICHLLLLGGLDTVTATLDCMIAYLAQHPDRRQAIVDNPELMDPAIEEMLRQQTPVMMVPRVIAQDFELGGVKMAAGRQRDADDRRGERRRGGVRGFRRRAARPRIEPPSRVRRRAAPVSRLAPRAHGAAGRARGVPQAHPRVQDRRRRRDPLLAGHPPGRQPAARVPARGEP